MGSAPTFSLVTVVYNDVQNIERTLRSVQAQTYTKREHILMDGGSTDGTVELIQKHRDSISHWKSEPDRGIYDAMNKGLAAATGEYVWFLNSGDELYRAETLEAMDDSLKGNADALYGETMYINRAVRELGLRSEITPHRLPTRLAWQDFCRGMVVSHQSFLVRRRIAPSYDLRYPHSGDIDWIIQCLKKSTRVINTGMILSKFLVGGHSEQFRARSLLDRFKVLQHHFGTGPNWVNHVAIMRRALKFYPMRGLIRPRP